MINKSKSNSVALVTHFIDIGRGSWEGWPNRTQDNYFDYFNNIAKLDNPIYIYINDTLKSRVLELREGRPTYFIKSNPYYDFKNIYSEIKRIHKLDFFIDSIPEHLKSHPEYWSSEYVFVTLLKSYMVKLAIDQFDIKEDLISWIDFGYKRNSEFVGNYLSLPFLENKITVFSQKKIDDPDVYFSILNNDVYIMGSPVIASKNNWIELSRLCNESIYELFKNDIIDDDQGIWLMSYIKNKNLFNVIVTQEWFPLFKYNTSHIIT
jgi:protein YibB